MTHYSFPDHRVGESAPELRVERLYVWAGNQRACFDADGNPHSMADGFYYRVRTNDGRLTAWCGPIHGYHEAQAAVEAAWRATS